MSTHEARATWDAEAAAFDDEPDHGLRDAGVRAAWATLLSDHLPPAPARVADLGCGTGTLSVLLAGTGYAVDGLDVSPRMLELARAKAAGLPVTLAEGDAADPDLPAGSYDVVLCRHVLWALPDQVAVLGRWGRLLRPGGRMLLVEGRWWTGGGLSAEVCAGLVRAAGRPAEVVHLDDPAYWGRDVSDERYLVVSR